MLSVHAYETWIELLIEAVFLLAILTVYKYNHIVIYSLVFIISSEDNLYLIFY